MKSLIFIIGIGFSSLTSAHPHIESRIANFTDCLGRTTLEPSKNEECLVGQFDNNNALLYSGELALLLKDLYGEVPKIHKNKILDFLPSHFIKKGLLTRHPEPYRFNENMRPISFDELTGVAMMAAVIPEVQNLVDDIVLYGLNNHWQYWDVPNHEFGVSWFNLLKPDSLKQWTSYLSEESLRKSTIKYKKLYPIFATHHIHQRAFYKMMSKSYKPNLFEILYFSFASYFSESKDNASSLTMWLFRWKALENKPFDHFFIKQAQKSWVNSMKQRFGLSYEEKILESYFENREHPFHLISKENSLKKQNKNDIIAEGEK